jgi:Na+/H+-translocating membrane pyrophosphatase
VENLPEDDPHNPGTIADNVGDNVGDVAGMGSDLFGSFGEASCAALLVGASSPMLVAAGWGALLFPMTISGVGILVCLVRRCTPLRTSLSHRPSLCGIGRAPSPASAPISLYRYGAFSQFPPRPSPPRDRYGAHPQSSRIPSPPPWHQVTSFVATDLLPVKNERGIESALKMQLLVSTVLMTPAIYLLAYFFLPAATCGSCVGGFIIGGVCASPLKAFFCVGFGLWGGCAIGFVTEYYTSFSYAPVQVAHAPAASPLPAPQPSESMKRRGSLGI